MYNTMGYFHHYPYESNGGSGYLQRAEKIMQRVKDLSSISENNQGITRTFGTDAFIAGPAAELKTNRTGSDLPPIPKG